MIDPKWRQRFDEKWVAGEKGCWVWTGAKLPKGYGFIKVPRQRKQEYAHRLAWMIYKGEIPEGLYVLHTCDNPSCVNPAHLMLGTQKDNLDQMVSRDRHLYGERNSEAKLTEKIVENIHRLYAQGNSQERIGVIYGVHQMTVSKILRGIRWKHIKLKMENLTP